MGEGMIVRRGGSGGARLRVLAAADAALLPESAKDGTVGIVSDTAVGAVYAQQDEPTGAVVVGDVWVRTGLSADHSVNLAKKGSLMVYVRACYRWDGTAFVRMATYIRTNGAWALTDLVLYQDGNEEEAVTGGWVTIANTIKRYDNRLYLAAPASYHAIMITDNQIDVTNYNTMQIVGAAQPDVSGSSTINTSGSVKLVLRTERSSGDYVTKALTGTFTEGTVGTLDISAVTGSFYVSLMAYNLRRCYVRSVRLLA